MANYRYLGHFPPIQTVRLYVYSLTYRRVRNSLLQYAYIQNIAV